MNKRPEFWDFYRAISKSKKEDGLLEVRSKETGKVTVYYKTDEMQMTSAKGISAAVTVILIIAVTALITFNDLWRELQMDLNLVNLGIGVLLNFLIARRIYNSAVFEEVTEDEWEDCWQSRRKPRWRGSVIWKSVIKLIAIAAVLFVFLCSYSYTYFRYLAEGEGKQSSAQVSFKISENIKIILDDSTPGNAVFAAGRVSDFNDVMMKVTLKKIPDKAALYVNGNEIEMNYTDKEAHLFWEKEYFESVTYIDADLSGTGEINTLQIKAGNFNKVWTFTIKQE